MKITKYFNWFTVSIFLWMYIGVNFINGVLVSPWILLLAWVVLIAKIAVATNADLKRQGM
nr:hypothetical protein [uncultured Ligilactobacillus sp.]